VFAGVPLQAAVTHFGWRPVMIVSAIIPLVTAILIWLIVRDDPSHKGYDAYIRVTTHSGKNSFKTIRQGLAEIFRYRNTLIITLVPNGLVGAVLAFSGLWGVPFLTTHHHFSKNEAAMICSAILVAWAVGGPLLGALSDRIGSRKPLYIAGCAVIAVFWTLIAAIPAMPSALLITLLLVIGFATGCMIIGFAFGKESVPAHLSGTVSGVLNMGVMIGPMLMQPAVGFLLDRYWDGQMINGVNIFPLKAYQSGFILMAVWTTFSLVVILFAKETHCKPLDELH